MSIIGHLGKFSEVFRGLLLLISFLCFRYHLVFAKVSLYDEQHQNAVFFFIFAVKHTTVKHEYTQ
jgi:hypothetical protein